MDGSGSIYSDKYSFHPAGGLYSEPVEFAKVLIGIMDDKLLTKESEARSAYSFLRRRRWVESEMICSISSTAGSVFACK